MNIHILFSKLQLLIFDFEAYEAYYLQSYADYLQSYADSFDFEAKVASSLSSAKWKSPTPGFEPGVTVGRTIALPTDTPGSNPGVALFCFAEGKSLRILWVRKNEECFAEDGFINPLRGTRNVSKCAASLIKNSRRNVLKLIF